MKIVRIKLNHVVTEQEVRLAVQSASQALALRSVLARTLNAYPGSLHWHFKSGTETGTLEATLWPKENRLWLSVQSRRDAAWVDSALRKMKSLVERELRPGER